MAALGARTLALVFGAGYSGSFIYNNRERARTIADAILGAANSSESKTEAPPQPYNNDFGRLTHQVDRLTREVARNRSDPVVIMGAPGYKGSLATVSDVFNLMGWAVVVVSLGGVVYYVAFRKKLRLSDLAWVSQKTFTGTVDAMQNGIAAVRDTIGNVKKDLTNRLGLLKDQVDDVRDSLSNQIESEVGEVQKGVADVGSEVAGVKDVLGNVRSQIDDLDSKLELATTGIIALVKAVSNSAPGHLRHDEAFQELHEFARLSGKLGEIGGGMLRKRVSSAGLHLLLGGPDPEEKDRSKRMPYDKGSPNPHIS